MNIKPGRGHARVERGGCRTPKAAGGNHFACGLPIQDPADAPEPTLQLCHYTVTEAAHVVDRLFHPLAPRVPKQPYIEGSNSESL
jgi:hypothetical protein